MKTILTAKAITTGGRGGHSESPDGAFKFDLAMPGAPNPKPGSINPEQLFAHGYSACFGGALEFVARQQKISVEGSSVQAEVGLHADDSGFFLSVVLDVNIPGMDAEAAKKLVEAAHQTCPYSKATRGNIEVTLKANQQPVGKAA